jgi:hypothetical protein
MKYIIFIHRQYIYIDILYMNNICIMHNLVLIVSDSSMLQILIFSKTCRQVCPLNSSKLRWVIESILGLRASPGRDIGYPSRILKDDEWWPSVTKNVITIGWKIGHYYWSPIGQPWLLDPRSITRKDPESSKMTIAQSDELSDIYTRALGQDDATSCNIM